jgi:hypothetical protein
MVARCCDPRRSRTPTSRRPGRVAAGDRADPGAAAVGVDEQREPRQQRLGAGWLHSGRGRPVRGHLSLTLSPVAPQRARSGGEWSPGGQQRNRASREAPVLITV